MQYLDPLQNAASAFLNIWDYIPSPIRALFYVSLGLTFLYALYRLLSR